MKGHIIENNVNDASYTSPSLSVKQNKYSVLRLIPISLAKTGIGVTIVAFSSFLNSELTFRGWAPSIISLTIGSTAIFELIRFVFARLSDKNNRSRRYYLVGFFLALFGISMIPSFLEPPNTYLMIIPMMLFYMGSAIMSTLIDSHMTAISTDVNRTNIATAIQITRLSGFAIGGIFGSRIFVTRGTVNELQFAGDFFTSFTVLIFVTFLFTGLVTLYNMRDKQRRMDTSSEFNLNQLFEDVTSPYSKPMFVFLFLYPIGMFMQDQILEPFAIIRLGFRESQIGTLVMLWASLTLIFAPIGSVVAKRVNKLSALISGQLIGSTGLVLIAFSGYLLSESLLYVAVVLFGIGSGLFAVTGVTYMLDIAARHKRNLAMLISFFGIMQTISRSAAPTLAAIILHNTNDHFELVFIIEAVFFILCIIPILKLERLIKRDI
jgi:MFS family permease